MGTISYKCDTCKRDIELLENIQGMTVFSKCVITEGCKGKLYVTDKNPDGVRESFPSDLSPLDDYTKRRAFFEFNQNILSNTWKIQHDMSVAPAVTIYVDTDGVITELSADDYTINTTTNNTEVVFSQPIKGIAHLVARSSVPLTPSTVINPETLFQLSNDGVITFAVPKFITTSTSAPTLLPFDMSNREIEIEICLEIPDREVIVCTEQLPVGISSISPWISWGEILVRKRRNYYPRTKDILDFNVFEDSTLTLDDIEDGTKLSFKRINYGDGVYRNLESRGLFILLAQSPYAPIDKLLNQLLDVGELASENPNFLVFKGGELYADLTAIENIYPDIARVISTGIIPTPTPTVTPTLTVTPSVTPTAPVTPSVTPTLTVTPSVTPTLTVTPSVTPTISITPSVTPSVETSPTPSPTISVTPSITPTPSASSTQACIDLTTVFNAVEGTTSGSSSSTFGIPITYTSKPTQSSLFTWDLTALPSLPAGTLFWKLTVSNSNLEGVSQIKFNRQPNGTADFTQPIFGDGVIFVATTFDFTTLTNISIENAVTGPQLLGDSFDFTIELNCADGTS